MPRSLTLLLFLLPSTALAHAPIPGMSSFVNGALHPFLIPAHLMILTGLGLLVGRQGSKYIGRTLPLFMLAIIPSLIISTFVQDGDAIEFILLFLAILLGTLVAAGIQLNGWGLLFFALGSALLIGLDSSQTVFTGKDRYLALGGTAVSASMLLIYITGFSEFLQKLWQGVLVRIIGSWLVASSLMVLVLKFKT